MIRREIRDGGEGVERGLRWKQREDRDSRDAYRKFFQGGEKLGPLYASLDREKRTELTI